MEGKVLGSQTSIYIKIWPRQFLVAGSNCSRSSISLGKGPSKMYGGPTILNAHYRSDAIAGTSMLQWLKALCSQLAGANAVLDVLKELPPKHLCAYCGLVVFWRRGRNMPSLTLVELQ